MKITKGKIILAVIVVYFSIMAVKNINLQKTNDKEILNEVTIVDDGKIHKENDGKLVLVTGKINYDGTLSFLELDHTFDTFKVERTVEDYIEKTSPGGTISHEWKSREEGYESSNYLYTLATEEKTLDTKIGEFTLDNIGMDKVKANKLFYDKDITIDKLGWDGLYYSDLSHEENEKVGDMRITYHYFDCSKVKYLSILAKQSGDSFIPYKLDKKTEIYNVYNGKVDTKDKLQKELAKSVKSNSKGKVLFILLILGVGTFLIVDSRKKN